MMSASHSQLDKASEAGRKVVNTPRRSRTPNLLIRSLKANSHQLSLNITPAQKAIDLAPVVKKSLHSFGFKTCPRCGKTKPHGGFYRSKCSSDGLSSYCVSCCGEYSCAWRKKNPDAARKINAAYRSRYRKRCPERFAARQWVTKERRMGNLKDMPCVICGTLENIEFHHPDYTQPKYVVPLCRRHHRKVDNGQMSLEERGAA